MPHLVCLGGQAGGVLNLAAVLHLFIGQASVQLRQHVLLAVQLALSAGQGVLHAQQGIMMEAQRGRASLLSRTEVA